MKETQLNNNIGIEITEEDRTRLKSTKLIGQLQLKPGHTCFEINTTEGTIEKAVFEKTDIDFTSAENKVKGEVKGGKRHKLIQKPNCIYICALNRKNAIKKYIKYIMFLKQLSEQKQS